MQIFFKKETIIYYIFSIYFFIGLIIFKDFGIGIEEHFQRSSGFFWLNYILQFTDFEIFKNAVSQKIIQIKDLHPNLPSVELAEHYGVIFDLPMAFLETFFNLDEPYDYFYLRHFFSFFIFFISSFIFYLLVLKRTKIYYIAIISSLFYLLSPRIFGNSFFDGKDLLFLSLTTIAFYNYYSYSEKKNFPSLILFSLISALCTSTRIIGLFFPISFLLLVLFQLINKNENVRKKYSDLFIYLIFYIFFLIIHWPYLWTIEIIELKTFFESFRVIANPEVFFNGNYYISEYLPFSYIPVWIAISTPEIIIISFLLGFFFSMFRLFKRFINIKNDSFYNDLWRGIREKFELFLFLSFFQILVIYLSFNLSLYGGWRHFLFLNFFVIYYASFFFYLLAIKFKNKIQFKRYFIILLSFFLLEIIYKLYEYHPYQSAYFNNFVSKKMKKKFEVDTQSLSRVEAIKVILKDSQDKTIVKIGTASWTPLENGRSLIDKNYWDKLNFTGTSNKSNADYIYTNYYYETNPRYEKKYFIPSNFKLIKSLSIDNTLIYSIYKNTQK